MRVHYVDTYLNEEKSSLHGRYFELRTIVVLQVIQQ